MTSPISAIEDIEAALNEAPICEYPDFTNAVREVLTLARQAEALQRENAELREALTPFAECAPEWEGEPDSLHVFLEWNDEGAPIPSLPVADFRRARALLGGENAE